MKESYSPLQQFFQDLRHPSIRVINCFKTALACLIGYLLTLFTPLPQSQWIVITILVVMSAQISVGGMIIKSYMRFIGTLLGALIATAIILLNALHPALIASELLVFSFLFSYLATSPSSISESGTLGAVTLAMILLNHEVNIHVAEIRFIEITIGIIVALLISSLIFPFQAHKLLLNSFSTTLTLLKQHFEFCLTKQNRDEEIDSSKIEQRIISTFQNQRKLLREVGMEPGRRHQKHLFKQALDSLIKIYRAINTMYYSATFSTEENEVIYSLNGLQTFKEETEIFLTKLAKNLTTAQNGKCECTIAAFVEHIENEFRKTFHKRKFEHIADINSFLFGAKLLATELTQLALLAQKIK